MQLNCPHCQNPITLAEPAARETVCPCCGSSIPVEPGGTDAYLPADAPRRLGKFEIVEQLGVGGCGAVYKARDTELGRLVAIKVPRAGQLATPQEADRFLREARAAANLSHPQIVALHDAVQSDGRCYLVSEYVEGMTLADRLAAGKLSFRESAELLAEVCDAVDYAHRQGVVHRDLKPANIMLEVRGGSASGDTSGERSPGGTRYSAKIMDFGLAKREAGEATLTLDGQVLGTPAYMSPEQARGDVRAVGPRSDVYSLGVILYELLTGELPFHGNKRMLLVQVLHDEPKPPRRLNDHIPRDLETIALRAMAKEPGRRYPSAAELAGELRRWLAGKPIVARPVGRIERTWRWCRRNPAVASLAAALAAAIVIGFAGITWKWREAHRQTLALAASQRETLLERNAAIEARDAAKDQRAKAETARKQAEAINELLTTLLGAAVPEQTRGRELTARQLLDRASDRLKETAADDEVVAGVHNTIGHTYRSLGYLDEATPHLEAALAIRRRVLGENHADTLSSLNNLALLLQEQGKLAEAEPLQRQALENRMRQLGEEDTHTLGSMNNLANLLYSQGKLAAAEELHRKVLEVHRRLKGESHRNTLLTMNNLAVVLQNEQKLEEAESLLREALEQQRQTLGPDHPDALATMGNLGTVLESRGDYAAAEPLLRQALEGQLRVLGAEHLQTLLTMNNLASVLTKLGNVAEAAALHHKALEAQRRLLGDDHPDTLNSLNNLGSLLKDAGQLDEAEPLFRKALEGQRRVLGAEHPKTLITQNNLAGLLMRRQQLDEAESLFRQVLEVRMRLQPDHSDTISTLCGLAECVGRQDKLDEARQLYQQAFETQWRAFPDDHAGMATMLSGAAWFLDAKADYATAAQWFRDLVVLRRKTLPAEDPLIAAALTGLGSSLVGKRELEAAEASLRESLAIAHKAFPEGDTRTAQTRSTLGACLVAQGRYAEAETELLAAYESLNVPAAPVVRRQQTVARLVELYEAWNKADDAQSWRAKLAAP